MGKRERKREKERESEWERERERERERLFSDQQLYNHAMPLNKIIRWVMKLQTYFQLNLKFRFYRTACIELVINICRMPAIDPIIIYHAACCCRLRNKIETYQAELFSFSNCRYESRVAQLWPCPQTTTAPSSNSFNPFNQRNKIEKNSIIYIYIYILYIYIYHSRIYI